MNVIAQGQTDLNTLCLSKILSTMISNHKYLCRTKGKMQRKKSKKKLTSVSFMYVCVAENADLLVFFTFFLHLPLIDWDGICVID